MKVLQLIDSLRPGGAEQMAVAYANALARRGMESFLCCTRMEGLLKKKVNSDVEYLFLEKKQTLDWRAFKRLKGFVKEHGIQIIQAHSSSYFLAVLVKWAVPGVKVIWHDHYGKELRERKDLTLKLMSRFFDGVISVNQALKEWAEENLKAKNIIYLKNFLPDSTFDRLRITGSNIKLKGEHRTKVICVANLRPQKDHFNLIRAFELLLEEYPDTSLHLLGKDEEDTYSRKLKAYVLEQDLKENIYFYGEQENVRTLLGQADIAVLSSASEGLSVALLEYGMAGLPVVCTDVGEVRSVLKGNGLLVPPKQPHLLAEALKQFLINQEVSQIRAKAFHKEVVEIFSETAILPNVITFYKMLVKN